MTFAFDTLSCARRLREAGVPPEAAEAHADAARAFIMTDLVTKEDLYDAVVTLRTEMGTLRAEMGTLSLAIGYGREETASCPRSSSSKIRCLGKLLESAAALC